MKLKRREEEEVRIKEGSKQLEKKRRWWSWGREVVVRAISWVELSGSLLW